MKSWRRDALISEALDLLSGVPEYIWDGRRLPVPIEEIADSHLGLLVREAADLASDPGLPPGATDAQLSGLLRVGSREILIDATEARRWPRRRRYTLAHEVAHWVLHSSDNTTVRCRTTDVIPAGVPIPAKHSDPWGKAIAFFDDGVGAPDLPPVDQMEDEANAFAGALLMPPHLMRRVYDQSGGDLERVAEPLSARSRRSPRGGGACMSIRGPHWLRIDPRGSDGRSRLREVPPATTNRRCHDG